VATNDHAARLLLLCRIGARRYGLAVESVERILPMAALIPLPQAANGVTGLLNVHGSILPVVDPRPRLGLPPASLHPDQHLVVVIAQHHYILWIDQAEQIVQAEEDAIDSIEADNTPTPSIARLAPESVPLLSPEGFDPGPLVAGSTDGR
jgi:chemotaxis signal transduction protein